MRESRRTHSWRLHQLSGRTRKKAVVTDGSNGLSHGLTFIDGACVHGLRAIGALIANAGLHNKSGHEPSMGRELDNGHRRYSRGCEPTNRLHKFSAASRRDSVPFELRITGMTRASTTKPRATIRSRYHDSSKNSCTRSTEARRIVFCRVSSVSIKKS